MRDMKSMLAKLEDLDRVLGPGPGEQRGDEQANMDAFQLLKKEIARDIQSVRKVGSICSFLAVKCAKRTIINAVIHSCIVSLFTSPRRWLLIQVSLS